MIDFRSRNHHDRKDPYVTFLKYLKGKDSVRGELKAAGDFLFNIESSTSTQIVVDSNHDRAFKRWLKEEDYRLDPKNAVFFLEAQLELYKQIERGNYKNFHVIEWALRCLGCPDRTKFLREDESFVTCKTIENGYHGDRGVNGSKGSTFAFRRTGQKMIVGDGHYAQILDGIYRTGISCQKDLDYNKGLSNWSHSLVVTYINGKRTIITVNRGKWKADMDTIR